MTIDTRTAAYLKRLHDDYPFFVGEIWKSMGWEKHGELGEIELDICQFVGHDPAPDVGVLAPRGRGKSHFVTTCSACWWLYRNHDHRIIVVAKSEDEAVKTIGLIRSVIATTPFLKHLLPKPGGKDSATAFDCGPASPSRQPSVSAFGIGGNLEGNRADLVLADDVETDTNTVTKANRDKLAERVTEFKQLLYKNKPGTRIIYVGTYHHEDSLYTKLAKERGYKFQTWPLLYPKHDENVLNLAPLLADRLRLNPSLADRPCFPKVTDAEVARLAAEGRRSFLMQQKLICDLSTKVSPLSLEDLMVMDVDPRMTRLSVGYGRQDHNGSTMLPIQTLGIRDERLFRPAMMDAQCSPYQGTKAFIDPAGRGNDETAMAVVGVLAGTFWVKAVHGQPGGVGDEQLDALSRILRDTYCTEAVYESNNDDYDAFYGAMVRSLERHRLPPGKNAAYPNGWSCRLTGRHTAGLYKEARIVKVLEPVISTHRLVIDTRAITPEPGVQLSKQLQFQLARLTLERGSLVHDDRLDALAGAVSLWVSAVETNPELARERVAATLEERFIRSGLASSLRPNTRTPTICPHRRKR